MGRESTLATNRLEGEITIGPIPPELHVNKEVPFQLHLDIDPGGGLFSHWRPPEGLKCRVAHDLSRVGVPASAWSLTVAGHSSTKGDLDRIERPHHEQAEVVAC